MPYLHTLCPSLDPFSLLQSFLGHLTPCKHYIKLIHWVLLSPSLNISSIKAHVLASLFFHPVIPKAYTSPLHIVRANPQMVYSY